MKRAVISHPDDTYRLELTRDLEARGFEVTYCEDGRALRQTLGAFAPALLITELRLSDGPALEIVEWVRQHYAETRVVVITAHDSIATAVHCLRLGVHAYHAKREPLNRVLADKGFGGHSALGPPRPLRLERAVWEYLNRVVDQTGSIGRGAAALGLDRRSLRRMLGKYAPPP